MGRLLAFARNFARNCRGVSAVEFSIVAPVLVAMVIACFEGGILTLRSYDMRAAINSGAQYFMTGGTDATAARAIVMAAWTRKSSDAQATISQSCKCASTVSACTALCADGSVPMSYYTLNASMTSTGMFTTNVITAQDTVRVR